MDQAFLIAPEVASHPFETLTKGRTWWNPAAVNRHYVYLTDAEASVLSGVPGRSLRTLQAAELIRATQAPLLAGAFKRVWHLPEVVTAAVVEEFKSAAGLNYLEASKPMYQAAIATKLMFAASCTIIDISHQEFPRFAPTLVVAGDRVVAIRADQFTQDAFFHAWGWPPDDRFDQDGLWVIAALDRSGDWKAIPDDKPALTARVAQSLRGAKATVTVNLAAVFRELEIKAKKLRS